MSLPRCALLWARLPAGRGAGPRAAPCSALRVFVGSFPGASGRVPCLAASSSASGGSKAPNTSLFVPLTVKPQGPSADGDVGAELTRPLDKSECWSHPAKRQGLRLGSAECNVYSFLEPSAPGPSLGLRWLRVLSLSGALLGLLESSEDMEGLNSKGFATDLMWMSNNVKIPSGC